MSTGIGERLRRLRHERGLSQEDVARRTGIGLKSYGDLERGKTTDPHYSTLRGIASALEVTVEELVEEPVPLAKASETEPGSVDVAEQSGLNAVRSFLQARTGTTWLALSDDEWDQWSLGVTRDEVVSRYEQIKAEWQLLKYERAAVEHGEPSVLRREGTQEVLNKMWPRVLEARYTAPREEESDKEFQRRRLEDKKFRTFYAPLEQLQPREAGTEDPSKEDAGA